MGWRGTSLFPGTVLAVLWMESPKSRENSGYPGPGLDSNSASSKHKIEAFLPTDFPPTYTWCTWNFDNVISFKVATGICRSMSGVHHIKNKARSVWKQTLSPFVSGYVEFPRTDNANTTSTSVRLSIRAYYLPNCDNTFQWNCAGSGRNSELTINTNNILLKVISDNFSTLQFTRVLKVVLHCFAFCVQCLLGGYHPPECTGVQELRITARSVSSEMLTIASRMTCFSAFKSTERLLYTSLFK